MESCKCKGCPGYQEAGAKCPGRQAVLDTAQSHTDSVHATLTKLEQVAGRCITVAPHRHENGRCLVEEAVQKIHDDLERHIRESGCEDKATHEEARRLIRELVNEHSGCDSKLAQCLEKSEKALTALDTFKL